MSVTLGHSNPELFSSRAGAKVGNKAIQATKEATLEAAVTVALTGTLMAAVTGTLTAAVTGTLTAAVAEIGVKFCVLAVGEIM